MLHVWTFPNIVPYENFYVVTANKQDKNAINREKNIG